MKKYRLKEYDNKNIVVNHYDFETLEEATKFMLTGTKDTCTYRIDEIKESIMDRVKSYEDACKVLSRKPLLSKRVYYLVDDAEYYVSDLPSHIVALLKLETITAALNEGWKPDWKDVSQRKYFIYISDDNLAIDNISVDKLCFSNLFLKSEELAKYAAEQFEDLYKQLLIKNYKKYETNYRN